ncbi:MAG: YcxB family protein [Clostridia bacterium]|nr:YcxB family protein [Clostridia bacterium]
MIRVKNEITAKDMNSNVNAQLIKPMSIRFAIGAALLALGIVIICLTSVKWLGIILSILGGIFCLLLVVMYFIVKASASKQSGLIDRKIEFEYRFDPRFFSVTQYIKGKKQGIMNLNYQDISRYKETKDKFYLYLKNNQSLIVYKNTKYAEGSPEALHRLLKERLSGKK